MLHKINAKDTINLESEIHYAIHTLVDEKQYPQVHDFYEFTLMAEGNLKYVLNGKSFILKEGDIIFVRPGDVHSKISIGAVKHINLAFPKSVIDSMFDFLYTEKIKNDFLKQERIPVITLNHNDKIQIESRLMKFAYFPKTEDQRIKSYLRTQLMILFSSYLLPVATSADQLFSSDLAIPSWIEKSLKEMRDSENFSQGLDWLVENSGKSKEHICRSFKKYLKKTPTEVINFMRLNSAANLLAHTDMEIIDIAYNLGFYSLSYFYNLFKSEFGLTPKKYRETSFYN